MKAGLSFLISDEEEDFVRQIDELKKNAAKKDAELSQLRVDLAEMKKVRSRFDWYFELCFQFEQLLDKFVENVAVCWSRTHMDLSMRNANKQLNRYLMKK